VGNVFGEHLEDFSPSLLRYSGAVGITTVTAPDSSVQLLVGFGSETFEHGGQVDAIRVAAAPIASEEMGFMKSPRIARSRRRRLCLRPAISAPRGDVARP
jgi:hypothetical protein